MTATHLSFAVNHDGTQHDDWVTACATEAHVLRTWAVNGDDRALAELARRGALPEVPRRTERIAVAA